MGWATMGWAIAGHWIEPPPACCQRDPASGSSPGGSRIRKRRHRGWQHDTQAAAVRTGRPRPRWGHRGTVLVEQLVVAVCVVVGDDLVGRRPGAAAAAAEKPVVADDALGRLAHLPRDRLVSFYATL